jgi:hypothetical protein
MDSAALAEASVCEKYTGSVLLGLEGVFSFKKSFSDHTIGELQMSTDAVYVFCCDEKTRTFESIAAVRRTEIAEYFVGCQ